MDAERREQKTKLLLQEKKFDHTVRAFHLEEIILRNESSTKRMEEAPDLFEKFEQLRIEKAQ